MDTLKLAIERIVKPITAPAVRKNIYRRELLAHLNELYEEQLQTGKSPEESLQRALEQLGQTQDLRREFIASLPLHYRLAIPVVSIMVPRESETASTFLRRSARQSWPLIIAAPWTPWIWVFMFISPDRLETTCVLSVAALALNLSLLECTFLSVVCLMEYRSRDNAPSQLKSLHWYRHYGTLPLLSMLPIALIPTTLYSVEHLLFLRLGLDATILADINLQITITFTAFMLFLIATAPLVWMLEARTTRTIPDWPYTKV